MANKSNKNSNQSSQKIPVPLASLPAVLLPWYDREKRSLPWRDIVTPYRTWVSEIMLQQTRVQAVLPYFERFMAAAPDVPALAELAEDRLRSARVMVDQYAGCLPDTYSDLIQLPGIGDYTAGAILSIAFNKAVPAVDGNVLRIAARLTACGDNVLDPRTRQHVRDALAAVMPTDRPGDFNQAMMDLGAAVCLPKNPNCESCPAASLCAAKAAGLQSRLPVREKNTAKPEKDLTVFLLTTPDGRTALRRRPETGLLSGLWEFPNTEGILTETIAAQQLLDWGLTPLSWEKRFSDRHIFTHLRWNITVFRLTVAGDGPPDWVWASDDRDLYPMPTAFKKLENK